MKGALVTGTVIAALVFAAPVLGWDRNRSVDRPQHGFGTSWDGRTTFMQPYKNNAYGPGIHSDATGRPFQWQTREGAVSHSNRVRPDGYGHGVGMDEYGRPVKPRPYGQ